MQDKRRFAPGNETGSRRPTILIVEDEILVRMAAAAHLRLAAGYEVLEAAEAVDAVRLLNAGPPIDLVFSDIHMPGDMDGNDLRAWILRERPDVKVLLTTGTESTSAGNGTERRHVIAKPYAFSELERRIGELLGP